MSQLSTAAPISTMALTVAVTRATITWEPKTP
jgi:hypothetical protein